MSTILQALQKSKLEQSVSPAPIMISNSQPLYWKIAISAALFIIIVLLSILIYLQLTPRNNTQPASTEVLKDVVVLENGSTAEKNNIVKINFDTQPLPTLTPKTAVKKVIAPIETLETAQKQQQTISATPNNQISVQNIDDIEPSKALKARFDMAVLLNEIEENEGAEDEFTQQFTLQDSTDIHQMSGNFQRQVPRIEYQTHMYSSDQQNRWIRINGEDLREGDFDSTGELELLEIQPQHSVFRLQRQSFTLESLSDWQGY